MIHYHGTPITPRENLLKLAGRSFCVSYADPRDVRTCHELGEGVMLDNGAFTFWRGGAQPDWPAFYAWAERWLDWPTTWAVIPDVIDGTEEDNDQLLREWFQARLPKGAPVWHMHEPLERLRRLAAGYERVCIGSSGVYAVLGTDHWHRRISEAFDKLADERGRVPWVHMLRGMNFAGDVYPFGSVDSANVARNAAGSWRQRPRPVEAMVAEADARQCPGRWHHQGVQLRLPRPDYDPHVDYPERYVEGPV